jgi:HSP20 family protein
MLLRTDPFREFDRVVAGLFDTAGTAGAPLDAYRDGDVFRVHIDLPGVDPASIEATVDRKVLTVRAERRRPQGEGVRAIVTERPTGTVTRRLLLGDTLDTDRLEASYDAGVLTLSIPVTEQAKPRRIEITTGGGNRELAAA